MKRTYEPAKAFTLIELSIVLVIIGLLAGGVLLGRDLVFAAHLRSLMKQIESYKTAVVVFREKFGALPGDIGNATTFFPADPNCGTGGLRAYIANPNGLTCNGDNDGVINGNYYAEWNLFWQHLNLAGLITEGPFTGTCAWSSGSCTANGSAWNSVNAPGFALRRDATVSIVVFNPDIRYAGYTNWFVPQGGQHVFYLAGGSTLDPAGKPVVFNYGGGALTQLELFRLDSKYDDGLPMTGNINGGYAQIYGIGNTTTANGCFDGSKSPATYYTASTDGRLLCAPMIKGGF